MGLNIIYNIYNIILYRLKKNYNKSFVWVFYYLMVFLQGSEKFFFVKFKTVHNVILTFFCDNSW